MRKTAITVMTAALITALAPVSALADDVSVRVSGGEIVFTETGEKADLTQEKGAEIAKNVANALSENGRFGAELSAAGDVSLTVNGEDMGIEAEASGSFAVDGGRMHVSGGYHFNGMGLHDDADIEAYVWDRDGLTYTAVSDGGDWEVSTSGEVSSMMDMVSDAAAPEEGSDGMLSALMPNFYEEGGHRYYLFVFDRESIMGAAEGTEAAGGYAALAEAVVGDNELNAVIAVDAETGLPYVISIDASNAKGTIPGELLGVEGEAAYECGDLYATVFNGGSAVSVEIPEEVLSTPPATDSFAEFSVDSLAESAAGIG